MAEDQTTDTTPPAAAAAPEAAAPTPAAVPPVAAPAAAPAPATPDAAVAPPGAPQNTGARKDIFLQLGLDTEADKPKVVRAKGNKNIQSGIVNVLATFNNTMVTITDKRGNAIGWSSSGKMGFRGSRKGTAYAAQVVCQDALRQAMGHGLREAEVKVKGPGSGRESAVRAVQAMGVEVTLIRDVTPVPHNGCRPPKARRV